jgi:replication factor A1
LVGSWTIKGICVQKAKISVYDKGDRSGKLFSATFMDDSGQIRGTFFNDEAEKFYPMLELDHIYEISGGRIKPRDTRFQRGSGEYEITFGTETEIIPSADDGSVGQAPVKVVSLSGLDRCPPESTVDLIGIVKRVEPVASLNTRVGTRKKRTILLVDQTGAAEVTLWGDDTELVREEQIEQPILIRSARITEFRGIKQAGVSNISRVEVHPAAALTEGLKAWWNAVGRTVEVQAPRPVATSPAGAPIALVELNKPDAVKGQDRTWFTAVGVTSGFSNWSMFYMGCRNCKWKKAVEQGGIFMCQVCHSSEHIEARWNYTLQVSDFSGQSGFQIMGEADCVMGRTAAEWEEETRGMAANAWQDLSRRTLWKWIKVRAYAETDAYRGRDRVKMVASSVEELDWNRYGKALGAEVLAWRKNEG